MFTTEAKGGGQVQDASSCVGAGASGLQVWPGGQHCEEELAAHLRGILLITMTWVSVADYTKAVAWMRPKANFDHLRIRIRS